MIKKMKYINYKNIFKLWILISILCVVFYIISLYTHVSKTFFIMLNSINIILFIFVLLFKSKIERFIALLINDFEKVNDKSTGTYIEVQYSYEVKLGILIVSAIILFGSYLIFLSITDVKSYYNIIQEDGIVEYASAILWFLAAIVLFLGLIKEITLKRNYNFHLLPHIILIVFFIVCAGEEITWGQRIFGFKSPEILKAINVQNETTLHNIGSISIFSNAFFLLTLIFFLFIPFLARKYTKIKNFLNFYSFPTPNRFVVYVFLISLFIWLFIGIRFGTLGFHPFSFYAQKYYTQMDDEIFEFFAAYCFFAFSIMSGVKHYIKKRLDLSSLNKTERGLKF